MNQTPDKFLTFAQLVEMTGLREETIRNGECGTDQLLRIELNTRNTVFSLNDVQEWMMSQARKALVTREWQEDAVREYLTRIGKARLRGGKKKVKDAQTTINGGFEYESEIEEDGQARGGEEASEGKAMGTRGAQSSR